MKHFRKGLRAIALYEAAKGVLVILTGVGLLSFIHRDLQVLGESLVRHLHLNPASHYPQIFIAALGNVQRGQLLGLALGAFAYSTLRLVEAYGLWRERAWAEWLAIASTGIYIPVEIYEVFRHCTWLKLALVALNVGLLGYLIYVRRAQSRTRVAE